MTSTTPPAPAASNVEPIVADRALGSPVPQMTDDYNRSQSSPYIHRPSPKRVSYTLSTVVSWPETWKHIVTLSLIRWFVATIAFFFVVAYTISYHQQFCYATSQKVWFDSEIAKVVKWRTESIDEIELQGAKLLATSKAMDERLMQIYEETRIAQAKYDAIIDKSRIVQDAYRAIMSINIMT